MSDDRPLFEKPLDDLLPDTPRAVVVEERERPVYDLPARELVAIARLQKQLLGLILLYLVAGALVGVVALVLQLTVKDGSGILLAGLFLTVFAAVIWILELIVIYRLGTRLYPDVAVFLLLLSIFVRCASIVVLLVLNGKATSTLKRNGIRVGLYGARAADLPHIEKRETTMPKLGW